MGSDAHRSWEYRVTAPLAEAALNDLGQEGWELVGVTTVALYLKRPRLDFRERVTLDQKRRYYALWDGDGGEVER